MIKRIAAAILAAAMTVSMAQAEPVRIMAAFTFKKTLDEVIRLYRADGGGEVTAIYGPTPALAKQIESAGQADIFLSADMHWMNYIDERGLIQKASRVPLLSTDLVIVTRADNSHAPNDAAVGRDFPLATLLGDGRIAMCNPADHPAGRFAREGLEHLGLWQGVAGKVALADHPPAAVALVVRGEAPAAVVFEADARGIAGLKIAGVFPGDSHPPIVFPAALLRDSHNPDAARFLSFLKSPKAAAAFEVGGYRPPRNAH